MVAAFDNTITNVQDALISVCTAFTDPNGGTVTAGRTAPTGASSPYCWVRRGRLLTRTENSADLFTDTRPFQVLVYVEALANGEMDDEAPFDNAINWIKPFHKHLAQNRNLYTASFIVVSAVRDTGDVSLFADKGKRYAGVVFTVPVNIMTRF